MNTVARTLYVRSRLQLAEWDPSDERDWDAVRCTIEDALSELERTVKAKRSNIEVRPGVDSGGAVRVFVYRTFKRSDRPNADPIVAGVTAFDDRIRADVCQEDSGRIIGPDFTATLDDGDVVAVAGNLAARLARRVDEIIEAVDDSSPSEQA